MINNSVSFGAGLNPHTQKTIIRNAKQLTNTYPALKDTFHKMIAAVEKAYPEGTLSSYNSATLGGAKNTTNLTLEIKGSGGNILDKATVGTVATIPPSKLTAETVADLLPKEIMAFAALHKLAKSIDPRLEMPAILAKMIKRFIPESFAQ